MAAPVKKNDDITLEITGMTAEGQGVGRHEGFAVFVPFALPGETVSAHIIKVSSSYAVGKLLEVIVPSSERADPPCPSYFKCGGCSLMHMNYPAQLEYKRGVVRDALERIGGFKGVEVKPAVGMDEPFRYRNKGSFPFGITDGKPEWGLFAPRSHRLIKADDCLIERGEAKLAADAVLGWAKKYSVPIYCEQTGKGVLRHVVIRSLTGGEAVCVVTTGKLPQPEGLVGALRKALPNLRSVVHNVNPDVTNVICGEEYRLLWGDETVSQDVCGMKFEVSAESFLQVNPIQTEKLYRTALESAELSEDMTAADIFCGIGTISLLIAKRAKSVVGIEYVQRAVSDARRNAELNGITNAEFCCGPAEELLPRLVKDGRRFDCVFLDPPRKGADRAVLEAIAGSGADKVIYISCGPASLARDLKILAGFGYSIESVQPVDMFPFTSHCEVVVSMSRVGSKL